MATDKCDVLGLANYANMVSKGDEIIINSEEEAKYYKMITQKCHYFK